MRLSIHFRQVLETMRRDGFAVAASKVLRRLRGRNTDKQYRQWIAECEPARQTALPAKVDEFPSVSVLMPTYNTPERLLSEAIGSVLAQTYPKWQLCIADDASTAEHIRPLLRSFSENDGRIEAVFREANGNISAASNSALGLVNGEFTALLDHDDLLSENALAEAAAAAFAEPGAAIIYSDHDVIDTEGRRYSPYFKPNWSPDLLHCVNYVNHLTVYRTALIKHLKFRSEFDGSQDYDLLLRASEGLSRSDVVHIPKVLYHWRSVEGSVALAPSQKGYAHERARAALDEHFERIGSDVRAIRGIGELHRMRAGSNVAAHVSVICFDRESAAAVKGDVLEVIEADPPQRIFAALQAAAAKAAGDVLCFVPQNISALTLDAVEELAAQALMPNVGVVGPLLVEGSGTIVEIGLTAGLNDGIGSQFAGENLRLSGFLEKNVVRNVSAVSIEAMTVRRGLFERLGGFDAGMSDEQRPDVDLSFRAMLAGCNNVATPFAVVKAAGRTVGHSDLGVLKKRFAEIFYADPYFNVNLSKSPPFGPACR
ncbi:MAG: glycosyltransferase [Acidobacteria bacterium]|nr:glycosyltransferase [Acidobacteriota bacterium]